jgi:hypothetical protein
MDTTTDFFERMFSCEGWDQLDTFDFVFYDCTLNRDIGDFKEGDKIDAITVLFSVSKIEFEAFVENKDGMDEEKIIYSATLVPFMVERP